MPSLLPEQPLDAAAVFNLAEAALWFLIAIVLLLRLLPQRPGPVRPRRAGWLPPAFLLFSISDLIEVHTGAWWLPWWLAVWKGGCILVFILVWLQHRRTRIMPAPAPAKPTSRSAG